MKYTICTIVSILLVVTQTCFAQKKKKPEVLVYGSGILAYSAAVQSAKSNVPTLWITDSDLLVPVFSETATRVENAKHTDSGIWLDVLMNMALSKKRNDSLATVVKGDMSPRLFQNAIERELHKLPNLTVIRQQKIDKLKHDKKTWLATLTNKQKYEVSCIIDATPADDLHQLSSLNWSDTLISSLLAKDLTLEQMRVLVASGGTEGQLYGIPLSKVLAGEKDNFFSLHHLKTILHTADHNHAPLQASIGQAIGATAAYMAFFKTDATKIDIRKLQSELMAYGARIVPFQDIAIEDPNFSAIQKCGLSGILKAEYMNNSYCLAKETQVRFQDVEPIFDKLYSRSQLWFLDNKGDLFRWKDFIALIKFVGLRGDEVEKQIQKDWSNKLRFDGTYDPEKFVNRYEFAVILDRYASPYVKAVNQQGKFIQ